MAKLDQWHPSQHIFTETLSGAVVCETIVCHGPTHPSIPESYPGKHVGVAEFSFPGTVCCCHACCSSTTACLLLVEAAHRFFIPCIPAEEWSWVCLNVAWSVKGIQSIDDVSLGRRPQVPQQ